METWFAYVIIFTSTTHLSGPFDSQNQCQEFLKAFGSRTRSEWIGRCLSEKELSHYPVLIAKKETLR